MRHDLRVAPDNARELIRNYDLVADGSDNFATRYLVSDACYCERKPLVTAAVGPFDASLTTLRPFEIGAGRETQPDLPLPFLPNRRRRELSRPAPKPAFSAH